MDEQHFTSSHIDIQYFAENDIDVSSFRSTARNGAAMFAGESPPVAT